MEECCKTCGHNLKLTRFDYTDTGCKHTEMEGFICTAFAFEGDAIWMMGLNQEKDLCECFYPRSKKTN